MDDIGAARIVPGLKNFYRGVTFFCEDITGQAKSGLSERRLHLSLPAE
jgi:hypothetical protein